VVGNTIQTEQLHGRRLHEWTWRHHSPESSPYDELADAIIACDPGLFDQDGKLVKPNDKGKFAPIGIWHLRRIIVEHISTRA